ncbi:hypothetical protein BDN72DRAFT_130294 [Pluteus cervinus]|uniref:Uncharacterized protein n=1 Tax=Pluteus cervinus TaxID=181527 RepID=A0ACD3AN94_9AGAR|nr:hypothetical protein BDN72DRAFT_130294 [Pluteus cervinus]
MVYLGFIFIAFSAIPHTLTQEIALDNPHDSHNLIELLATSPQIEVIPSRPPSDDTTDDLTLFQSNASPTLVSEVGPSPKQSPTNPATDSQHLQFWAASPVYDDLSSFGVTKFSGGTKNLHVVKGIPASASAAPSPTQDLQEEASGQSTDSFLSNDKARTWKNDTSVIQLFYPKGSVNPSKKPVGGAQFYASPIDITDARNVTMKYCIFFTADFDFVRGGKLPGMYGGTMGCSGGNVAEDCFSTRLMWRRKGKGELYLYGPRGKQTKALCAAPGSECGGGYGTSVGRGSFTFARGKWTCVQQTVTLNTPGKQDGHFTLDVNGKRVIERHDILYRSKTPSTDDDDDSDQSGEEPPPQTVEPTSSTNTSSPSPTPATNQTGDSTGLLDGLSGLVNSILGGAFQAPPQPPKKRRLLRMERRQASTVAHTPSAAQLEAAIEEMVKVGEEVLGRNSTTESQSATSNSGLSQFGPSQSTPARSTPTPAALVSEPGPAPSPALSLTPSTTETATHSFTPNGTTTAPPPITTPAPGSEDDDDVINRLVGIEHDIFGAEPQETESTAASTKSTSVSTPLSSSTTSSTSEVPSTPLDDGPKKPGFAVQNDTTASTPDSTPGVGFRGIFFSSFFGGHGPEWASPKDQYVWFKDFALSHNA